MTYHNNLYFKVRNFRETKFCEKIVKYKKLTFANGLSTKELYHGFLERWLFYQAGILPAQSQQYKH